MNKPQLGARDLREALRSGERRAFHFESGPLLIERDKTHSEIVHAIASLDLQALEPHEGDGSCGDQGTSTHERKRLFEVRADGD